MIRRRRIADEVFDHLARAIIVGDYAPETPLPPERELAEMFEASRVIVRQALHRLAEIGLVRVRQGGATLVQDPAACDHPEVGVLLLRYSPAQDTLLAAWRERMVAGSVSMILIAARRVTPDRLAALRELVGGFDAREHQDHLNAAFWTHIADMTDNPFFARETRFWFRVARENPKIASRLGIPTEVRLAGYRAVIEALERSPSDAVRAYLAVADQLLDVIAGEAYT